MILKSELVPSNPRLYTSLFLMGRFPASNLIASSYYSCWDSPLLLHWVAHCPKLSVLLEFSPASNIWLLQVRIIVGLPPYFRGSYIGLSLLLGFLTCFQASFHTTYHSIVLLFWAFDACYLPIDLIKLLCQAINCIIWWFWNAYCLPWSLCRPQNQFSLHQEGATRHRWTLPEC